MSKQYVQASNMLSFGTDNGYYVYYYEADIG